VRDVLKACRAGFGNAWGDNKDSMVTRDVTIAAMLRLVADVLPTLDRDASPGAELQKSLEARFAPLSEIVRDFRRDGFWERFPARGQSERIDIIKKRIARQVGLG
jgi:hypothetical protein